MAEKKSAVTRSELKALIGQAVESAVAPLAERATDNLRSLTSRALPRSGGPLGKGAGFARIVRALGASRGIPQLAADFALRAWGGEGEAIAKALSSQLGESGGFLVPEHYAAEVIELLRARSVIRRAGALVMPMNGSLLVPKITASASARYIGENQAIDASQPSFGQLRLTARKLAALVPLSNDLLRTASPQADTVVLEDLVAAISVSEDAAFLTGDGTNDGPRGLRSWATASHVIASRGTTAADVEGDLKDLVNALETSDVRMLRPAWFMAPRSRNHLYVLRDGTGNLLFPELRTTEEGAPFGRLWGYPVFSTTSVPANLGVGADESEVYLADMADAVIAEDGQIEVSISDTAAYHSGGALVAAFSQDQTVVRAILRHDFALRHDVAVAVKTGVLWGA